MYLKSLEVLVALCLLIIAQKIECLNLSEEEEIVKEFKVPEKPSIQTIQDQHGDVYDCVDFYMQPAFDHPLLKNHTFHPHMKPTYALNGVPCHDNIIQSIKLKNGGCPRGTVPIKRRRKDEVHLSHKFRKAYGKSNPQPRPGTHFAFVQTNSDPNKVKYFGAGGALNIYNLSIVEPQYSSGEIVIQNGDDRIAVGWTINPGLYKDHRAHIFQYLDAGQSHCFDTLCPGFVILRKDIPIGVVLNGASKRGGTQMEFNLHVSQDAINGRWWLDVCGYIIGFWPNEIFTTMSNVATVIAAGGEAYSPTSLPPMGSGYYPVLKRSLSGYVRLFVVADEKGQWIDPKFTETYTDDSHYGAYDGGFEGTSGRVIYYGGTTMWP